MSTAGEVRGQPTRDWAGHREVTSKEIEMDSHLCGNRRVGKASDLMCRKDIEGVVPAGQDT